MKTTQITELSRNAATIAAGMMHQATFGPRIQEVEKCTVIAKRAVDIAERIYHASVSKVVARHPESKHEAENEQPKT